MNQQNAAKNLVVMYYLAEFHKNIGRIEIATHLKQAETGEAQCARSKLLRYSKETRN